MDRSHNVYTHVNSCFSWLPLAPVRFTGIILILDDRTPAEILFISVQCSRLRVRELNTHVGLILKEIPLKFSVKIKHPVLRNEQCTIHYASKSFVEG